jgi:hypothetical protein
MEAEFPGIMSEPKLVFQPATAPIGIKLLANFSTAITVPSIEVCCPTRPGRPRNDQRCVREAFPRKRD